jgi:hypothetical protein
LLVGAASTCYATLRQHGEGWHGEGIRPVAIDGTLGSVTVHTHRLISFKWSAPRITEDHRFRHWQDVKKKVKQRQGRESQSTSVNTLPAIMSTACQIYGPYLSTSLALAAHAAAATDARRSIVGTDPCMNHFCSPFNNKARAIRRLI